jgi:acyl-CoA thioester hydrolase
LAARPDSVSARKTGTDARAHHVSPQRESIEHSDEGQDPAGEIERSVHHMTGCSRTYARTLFAGWGDMDFNAHMRNTAFLDKSADVRMLFFAENGFSMEEFARLKVGPVVLKDEVEYRREVGLLQEIEVTLAVAGLSEDGSRFVLRNEILRPDGTLCARVTSAGGWLDLVTRKLVAPPEALLTALRSLPQTSDFASLASMVKERG